MSEPRDDMRSTDKNESKDMWNAINGLRADNTEVLKKLTALEVLTRERLRAIEDRCVSRGTAWDKALDSLINVDRTLSDSLTETNRKVHYLDLSRSKLLGMITGAGFAGGLVAALIIYIITTHGGTVVNGIM